MIINNFIKGLVDSHQVCIDDIADISGISVQRIEDIVNEKVTTTPNEAYRILKALGCNLEDVLEVY